MKKHTLLYFLFLTLCCAAFTSCGDDDDDDVSPNVSLLTNGEWTGSAIYYMGQNVTDDILAEDGFDFSKYTSNFERDGTYIDHYDDAPVVDGTWEYANNERVILFDEGTRGEHQVVISLLNENELHYVQDGLEYRFERN